MFEKTTYWYRVTKNVMYIMAAVSLDIQMFCLISTANGYQRRSE
jgi:hypothetical protein